MGERIIVVMGDALGRCSPRMEQLNAERAVDRAFGVAPKPQAEVVVTYRSRTLLARWWVKLMGFVAPVIGRHRAIDWAIRGAKRLIGVKVIRTRHGVR